MGVMLWKPSHKAKLQRQTMPNELYQANYAEQICLDKRTGIFWKPSPTNQSMKARLNRAKYQERGKAFSEKKALIIRAQSATSPA